MRRHYLLLLLCLVIGAAAWIAWPKADEQGPIHASGDHGHADSAGDAVDAEEERLDPAVPVLEGRAAEVGDKSGRAQPSGGGKKCTTVAGTCVLVDEDG